MLKYIPLIILLTSCQALGIKSSDTIEQAEMKVVHVIEEKSGIISDPIHPEAEPPYICHPSIAKS